jgi:hypothetical protein
MMSSNNRITYKANQKGSIMKTKYVLLSAARTIVMTLMVFGQNKNVGTTKIDMKKHDMLSMMGKPIVDAKVEGLHLKVWLITQKQHKGIIKKDMKWMEMNNATKETMLSGTHHIMLDITDSPGGKEITDASAKVLIEYPSKRNSSFELKPVMSHFGRGLTLNEKGKYKFKVVVIVNGVPKSTQFKYTVK